MTTLATLFGGLLLVFVLYAATGLVRQITPLGRVIVASGVPLLIYFIRIAGDWPGLDVAAMHVSVFLATGFLLYVWKQYRARGGRLHWAPRVLIGFFALLALINAALLYVSTRGLPQPIARWWFPGAGRSPVHTGFSGVVAHGEEAAKPVSSALKTAHALAERGWQVDIADLGGEVSWEPRVTVRVRDRTGLPVAGLAVDYTLARPGAASAAARGALAATAPGEYSGVLDLPGVGRWLIEVRVSERGQLLYTETLEVVGK
jgi:nitrogen fixation protein FixH